MNLNQGTNYSTGDLGDGRTPSRDPGWYHCHQKACGGRRKVWLQVAKAGLTAALSDLTTLIPC